MLAETKVGPRLGSDGVILETRSVRSGAIAVADAHGRFMESVMRGNCFIGNVKSATVTATTDISPIPASTGRSLLGIYNPPNSGKNCFILRIGLTTVSGTPGGPFYLDYIGTPSGILNTIGGTPTSLLTLSPGGLARTLNAVVPAQTLVGTMLRPLVSLGAIALGAGIAGYDEATDGLLCVPPGAGLVTTAHATGTSQVISGYMIWEELPV